MATKRNASGKRRSGKPAKTNPERISGISRAAIEGAQEADQTTDNAEKMARPGPGLPDRRTSDARPDDFEDFGDVRE